MTNGNKNERTVKRRFNFATSLVKRVCPRCGEVKTMWRRSKMCDDCRAKQTEENGK